MARLTDFKLWIPVAFLGLLACSAATEPEPGVSPGAGGGAAGATAVGGAAAGAPLTSAGSGPISGAAGTEPNGAGGGGAGGGGAGGVGGVGGAGTTSGGAAGGVGGGAPGGFVHPGILVNRGMLDFVKGKLVAKAEPWQAALDAAKGSKFGALSYQPKPRADVQCGPTSNPDIGCSDEKNDVIAAYTHALLWHYTEQRAHADKAIEIMNAWSAVLQKHSLDNQQLQAAWCAEMFPRAAEIIRYSQAGWADPDIARFEDMLRRVYLPQVKDGSTRNGNWDTSAIDAAMNIAVFLDDKAQFDQAVALWKARVPAYIYLKTDGALPVQPPRETARSESSLRGYWYNPKQFIDGLSQESCRDRPGTGTAGFGHAQYGVSAILNAAETARIQAVDLFSLEQRRLTAFLELHSKFLNGASTVSLCDMAIAGVDADPMWEIGYNAYAGVLGVSLPETLQQLSAIRPTGATHHMAWETLTHGAIGSAGL